MLNTGVPACELEITNGSERVKGCTPLLQIQNAKYGTSDVLVPLQKSKHEVEIWTNP